MLKTPRTDVFGANPIKLLLSVLFAGCWLLYYCHCFAPGPGQDAVSSADRGFFLVVFFSELPIARNALTRYSIGNEPCTLPWIREEKKLS